MKKRISILALGALLTASTVYGSGYRIPEQSINSTALANAYVANTNGADTSYFNPANMSWQESGWLTDVELMYIHLPNVTFTGTTAGTSVESKEEDFVMPVFHMVSPEVNDFRFGLSVVFPGGLSKRWSEQPQRTFAEDFTLKTTEVNPTVSYKFCDIFSAAVGARLLYADGDVKSQADIPGMEGVPAIRRDLEGDSFDYGYNLALTVKPLENVNIGATYRSKITMEIEGDATLYHYIPGATAYSATVDIPLPAVLTLGAAYSFKNTVVELVYDKTYWSEYEFLDFNYSPAILPYYAPFDAPVEKAWEDTDAFRLGITHQCTDKLTTMFGIAIDENPVPDKTLGYELPDSDAVLYSLGFKYKLNQKLEIGAAYLYDDKDERTVSASVNDNGIDGEFSDGGAHLFNIGANYIF